MFSRILTLIVGFLTVLLGGVNNVASLYGWYVEIWWLDVLMHASGGLFVGLVALWFYYDSKRIISRHHSLFFKTFMGVAAATVVGAGYEFYEYIFLGQTGLLTYEDTLADLALDMTGGLVAGIVYLWRKN